MSRLLRRFRVLLPPSSYIVAYVLVYLVASLPLILAPAGMNPPRDQVLRYPPVLVHFAGLVMYGIYRASAFHPFFREDYRRWLETTPWTLGKPLPVGPAHLVWEDALVVAAAGLPEWLSGDVHPLASYSVAIGAYLLWISMTYATTGARGYPFAVLFGVGLAVRLWRERPEVYAAAMLLTYMVGLIGLRRSFRHWPWADIKTIDLNQQVNAAKATALGWPYDRLGPPAEPAPARGVAWGYVFGALVAGWWCYALEHVILDPNGRLMMMRGIVVNITLFLVSIRLASMLTGYAPPISLAGRVARLRPLIPSYDQVFLSPIAAVLSVTAAPAWLERGGVPRDISLGISTSLALLALWIGGPERRTWHLTAKHRITPGINGAANKTGDFVQTG